MKKNLKNLSILSLFAFLPSCVPMDNGLQAQIDAQNLQIQQLNAQLANMQPAQADSYLQMQSMNQELNMMRGSVDDLEYRLQNINPQEMQKQIAEHDRALRAAQTQLGVELQLGEEVAMPSPQVPKNAEPLSMSSPMNLEPAEIVANTTQALTDIIETTPLVEAGAAALSAGTALADTIAEEEAISEPTPSFEGDATAQLLYDSGIKAFNDRKYQNALKSFTDFANVYTSHSLVSNALFWQGECHYQLKNYPQAALAYEKVISTYPNSNKAAAAYLKQGMTFANLNKKDAAKERYTQLVEIYPKAPEATRAKEYLKNY